MIKHIFIDNIEFKKLCFHYTNLQPLWAVDNYKKGSKVPSGLENINKESIEWKMNKQ